MVRSLICLALSGSEVEQMCDTLTTPLPGDVHAPHAKLLTQRNNKAEKQACATVFLFFCNYKSIRAVVMGEKPTFETEGFSAAVQDMDSFGASFTT